MSRPGVRSVISAAVASFLIFSSCTAPGKPGAPEPLAKNITDFKVLYGENCSGCHGADGRNGPGRILNDALYLAVLPKDSLRNILIYGRPGTAMPPWAVSQGGPLYPKQIDALVEGIEKNWSKPVNLHGTALPTYTVAVDQGDPDKGRKLFGKDCFMCHGPGAKVGPVTDPTYLSLASNQMIRTSIIVGRPDLGMPDYRNLNLGRPLADQDITDLVAYLVSKRPQSIDNAQLNASNSTQAGEQVGPTGSHVNENGSGQGGASTKGNEGSGNGPGSPRQQKGEGNRSVGASSQAGGIK